MLGFKFGALLAIALTFACQQSDSSHVAGANSNETPCPTFTADLSTLHLGTVDEIYTYVTAKNFFVGTNENVNQLIDNVLTVQPKNCRSFPEGEWYVTTIQLIKVEPVTNKRTTINRLYANLAKNLYEDNNDSDKDTSIGLSFTSFAHPDNLFDKVVDPTHKHHVSKLLSHGCQFNQVDGFTPCEPVDKRFYYIDEFYRQLDILIGDVKSPFGGSLLETQQTAIIAAIEANQRLVAGKYNYVATISPYVQKLLDLGVASNKSFTKAIYLSWADAMPVIDYLQAELMGNETRMKSLATLPEQTIMLTTYFHEDQDPGALNIQIDGVTPKNTARDLIQRLDQISGK